MNFNHAKLRGKIREVFGTQKDFAAAMRISPTTLSHKLTCKIDFSQTEIRRAVNLLGLQQKDIITYFFTPKV